MKTINVTVRDKIASAVGDIVYICGNSDYIIDFDFDAEWDENDVKTARFAHDGSYTDVVFTGNQCAMPVIHKAYGIYVGVYAGDLRTTTPAHIPSAASILSAEGTPAEPPDDVYAQITALCEDALATANSVRNDADVGKFNGAPGKTPVAGEDYFTEEDKQKIASDAAEAVGFPQPTSEDNGKFLGCADGKAAWLPVEASGGGDISLGLTSASVGQTIKVKAVDENGKPTEWEAADLISGGEKWELLNSIEITEAVNTITISTDKDGNPLSLKKAVVVFEINIDTEDPFIYIKMTANGFTIAKNDKRNGTSTKWYLCYIFDLVPGFGITTYTLFSNVNFNWIFARQKTGYKYNNDFKAESMNYFNIMAYGSDFSVKNVCASGKIDVFGVRA